MSTIDRLARSPVDLRSIIDQITDKGASVHFVKENLTFSKDSTYPRATLMLGILGSFPEFERGIVRERQAEGIALAKKAGKCKGRKRALTPEGVEEARRRAEAGESKITRQGPGHQPRHPLPSTSRREVGPCPLGLPASRACPR